ncbi:hypothetical protein HOT29_gp087 [Microbacterium phage Squash]|uniref:Uncharacterized protein n=1 Tax=Microbacterium phage Squash TaxID=2182357 RepID=A0A2U8UM24_9CAUD|nr:hypothetical protein HOT29_gp087 [Microbacterium phage Squash]AWN04705.1 hypothetical protein PBI_SQUASH_87 [Microbacterium phage Squash]
MTDQIPMRSASERRDAARAAVAEYEARSQRLGESVTTTYERALYSALIPLLEVPEVGITEDEIVKGAIDRASWHITAGDGVTFSYVNLVAMLTDAVRTAERAALEHWEPADIPSQEFMLRHLGIDARPARIQGDTRIFIPAQYIEREVI